MCKAISDNAQRLLDNRKYRLYAEAKSHIPPSTDLEAQAKYYKKYYNTDLGKASHKSYLKRRAEVLVRGK